MNQLKPFEQMIGHTPLVEIHFTDRGIAKRLFAKVEYYNLSGSIKDRMAYRILKEAYASGALKPGDTIVEATSGNTGIAFCALGAYLGHPVRIYMPDWMSEERVKLIESFGATIVPVSKEEGGFLGSIEKADAYVAEHPDSFLPHQFSNPMNAKAQCDSLGMELIENLKALDLICDGFVAGVGTGGTVMGVAEALRHVNPNAMICPLEPAESPTLSTGGAKVDEHRIAGISDEFIPELLKLDTLDRIIGVSDRDAILMAQKLAAHGLGVGISSGANFLGALDLLEQLGEEAIVATVFADDSKKYLSTDLMATIQPEAGDRTPDIEITEIIAHR